MTIEQIMKILSKVEMDTLMAAFEAGSSAYIEWTPNRFIGVGTDGIPHLQPTQVAGLWREGIIQKGQNETRS